ncbi:hypothetical protein E2C01_054567 [Portunus trituberculatus]|uniref:Uncharacterized protein n=1 Tax=Portunus trituberculatus TaxID=210409 RepID=A0A5B7GSD7_PORTR|nr:hypothetical protein [Portunus trituberculatus]
MAEPHSQVRVGDGRKRKAGQDARQGSCMGKRRNREGPEQIGQTNVIVLCSEETIIKAWPRPPRQGNLAETRRLWLLSLKEQQDDGEPPPSLGTCRASGIPGPIITVGHLARPKTAPLKLLRSAWRRRLWLMWLAIVVDHDPG